MPGTVVSIHITPSGGNALATVEQIRAVAGRGLEGDRYFAGSGSFSRPDRGGQALTLIESEALEALAAEDGIQLGSNEARRNVVTRGIALNDLVGRRFLVGAVECLAVELCEPCATLESRTQPGVLRGLVHRGGLNVDILTDGVIAVGDAVEALEARADGDSAGNPA